MQIAPWEEVAIDLIGIWKTKVKGRQIEFSALTCIDTVYIKEELRFRIRQPNIFMITTPNLGDADTIVLYNVHTIRDRRIISTSF